MEEDTKWQKMTARAKEAAYCYVDDMTSIAVTLPVRSCLLLSYQQKIAQRKTHAQLLPLLHNLGHNLSAGWPSKALPSLALLLPPLHGSCPTSKQSVPD
eukprot:15325398-Ditylum_brightwellii.AAC.1